jgi:DNA modification methylase
LYTFEKEVVLDPFAGSGATCIAALKTNRFYVGYEINEEYVRLAERRVKEFLSCKSTLQLPLLQETQHEAPRLTAVSNRPLRLEDR